MAAVTRLRKEVEALRIAREDTQQLQGIYTAQYGGKCPYVTNGSSQSTLQSKAFSIRPTASARPRSCSAKPSPPSEGPRPPNSDTHPYRKKRLREVHPNTRAHARTTARVLDNPSSNLEVEMKEEEAVQTIQNMLSVLSNKYQSRRGMADSPHSSSHMPMILEKNSTSVQQGSKRTPEVSNRMAISPSGLKRSAVARPLSNPGLSFLRHSRPPMVPMDPSNLLPDPMSPPAFPTAIYSRPITSTPSSSPEKKRTKPVSLTLNTQLNLQSRTQRPTAPPLVFDSNAEMTVPVPSPENDAWLQNALSISRSRQHSQGSFSSQFTGRPETSSDTLEVSRPSSALASRLKASIRDLFDQTRSEKELQIAVPDISSYSNPNPECAPNPNPRDIDLVADPNSSTILDAHLGPYPTSNLCSAQNVDTNPSFTPNLISDPGLYSKLNADASFNMHLNPHPPDLNPEPDQTADTNGKHTAPNTDSYADESVGNFPAVKKKALSLFIHADIMSKISTSDNADPGSGFNSRTTQGFPQSSFNFKDALLTGRAKLRTTPQSNPTPNSEDPDTPRRKWMWAPSSERKSLTCEEDERESNALWEELGELVKEFSLEVDNSSVERHHLLGRGKWGAVYKAIHTRTKEDGECEVKVTALKEAQYNLSKTRPPLPCMQEFLREIKTLTRVKHSHITAIQGVVIQPRLSILLELMECGSLAQNIAQSQTWACICVCMKLTLLLDVARGLACLHRNNFVHRDVKGHNVLLKRNRHGRLSAKLADFGTSVSLNEDMKCYDVFGTTGYIAPEVYADEGYTLSADVFGYGMVCWDTFSVTASEDHLPTSCKCSAIAVGLGSEQRVDILTFTNPLAGLEADSYVDHVRQGSRPPLHAGIPYHLTSMISECWATDPSSRPSMDDTCLFLRRLIAYVNHVMPLSPSPRRRKCRLQPKLQHTHAHQHHCQNLIPNSTITNGSLNTKPDANPNANAVLGPSPDYIFGL